MHLRFVSCLLLLAAGLVIAVSDVDELKIETTDVPLECTLRARKGDKLEVHYVSSKFCDTT